MVRKTIDKLILMHFKNAGSSHNLAKLENDVWQKIYTIQADQALTWQEKMFLAFGVKEFRITSITLALLLGLGMGNLIPQEESASREIGLHVFATNVEYLPSNIFEGR